MTLLLENLFLSKARAKIFETLFLEEDKEFYLRELERKTGVGIKALHTDIHRLTDLDLLVERKDGNRTYFKANVLHPLYEEFHSIVRKMAGPEAKLKEIFKNCDDIEFGFIFGSYATNEMHAESDLDLFVVGKIRPRKLSDLICDVQKESPWVINPHCRSVESLQKAIKDKISFVLNMEKTKKVMLKGVEGEFRRIYRKN